MVFDIVLIAVIVGGIALSVAYVRAEYLAWREHRSAERRREVVVRDRHAARLFDQHTSQLLPSVLKLQDFGDGDAANPDRTNFSTVCRTSLPNNSSRTAPLADRRKRVRQCAS